MRRPLVNTLLLNLGGIFLVCGLGTVLVSYKNGEGPRRLSFDLLFHSPLHLHRVDETAKDNVIVYLDDLSHNALDQPYDSIWDRRLHAYLLDRLTSDGAKMVFYDIVFDQSSSNKKSDNVFAEAIANNGSVFLGAGLERQESADMAYDEIINAPHGLFRKKAKAWGMIHSPLDPDQGIRVLSTGTEEYSSATWISALFLAPGIENKLGPRMKERWLNYLGPPDTIPSVSFFRALQEDALPYGFFKDKIVFVGAKGSVGFTGTTKDTFRSPYRESGKHPFYNGVELHVMALDNLLAGNWYTRMNRKTELILVLAIGAILVLSMISLRPRYSLLMSLGAVVILLLVPPYICLSTGYFYSWVVPPFFLVPTAFLWSAGCHFFREVRRRNRLRRTFSAYLSPVMVKRLADADEEPQLGGHEENITAFFSDIESFSSFSESLTPTQLTEVMNTYLTEMTNILREQGGVLDKYIGDAIVGMFGALVDMEDHASKACFAAARMQERLAELRQAWATKEGIQFTVLGKVRARIGLNSGPATVGNFGSEFRFNYTMMGDMVNLAARCESGAKTYGVYTMAAEETKSAAEKYSSEFLFRFLDKVIVKGRRQPVNLYELVGFREKQPESVHECLLIYNQALEKYLGQDWEGAIALLDQSVLLEPNRPAGGEEERVNPSIILRNRCLQLEKDPPAKDWDGVYIMSSK